MALTDA